jgi:hypothetical protein
MQGYSKDSLWPSITVHYMGYQEASKQIYSNGFLAHYNGKNQTTMQGYGKGIVLPSVKLHWIG